MYGRSNTSNSRAPSGPNFASEGARICTDPNCSASISSPSLNSALFGYTSTLTRPLVRSSASFLKYSAPLPLGVSTATTWLNLMTIGCCANAEPANASSADAATTRKKRDFIDTSNGRWTLYDCSCEFCGHLALGHRACQSRLPADGGDR